jgi:hypothetical protein
MPKPPRSPNSSDAPPPPTKRRGRARRKSTRLAVHHRFTPAQLSTALSEAAATVEALRAKLDVEIAVNNRSCEIDAAKDKQIAGLYRDIRALNAQLRAERDENALLRNVVVDTAISSHANGASLRAAAKSRAITLAIEPPYPEALTLDQATDGASR